MGAQNLYQSFELVAFQMEIEPYPHLAAYWSVAHLGEGAR